MTKQEAINILDQVCAQFKGTRQEHVLLQQAMEEIKKVEDKQEPTK